MNTLEIFCKLLSIKSLNRNISFDVLAKDQLLTYTVTPPFALCVNTGNSNEEGSHWVAFYSGKKGGGIFFFCSFGYPIEFYGDEFLSFAKSHSKKIVSNEIQCQSFDSDTCGEFCIVWIMSKMGNQNWMRTMSGDNLHVNTISVKSVVKALENKNICIPEARSLCTQISKAYNTFR